MPYKLQQIPGKALYFVVSKETGKKHSTHPMLYDQAIKQMRALYYAMRNEKK